MGKYETIVQASLQIFKTYNTALTLRQLFYRLVSKRILDNTLSNYKLLSKFLVKARETGEVDGAYLEDRTRTTANADWGYDSIEEFIEACERRVQGMASGFSMTFWEGQHYRVEVWVEKDALSKLCSTAAGEYNVTTCPSRGYSSYTYVKDAADRISSYPVDCETVILYFGDYDPSGLDIERDLTARLHRYGAHNVQVKRVALSLVQIQEYKLPPFPAKTKDPRYARFLADTGGSEAVELDALEPPVLEALIKENIEAFINMDKWNSRMRENLDKRDEVKVKFKNARLAFNGEEED